MRNDLEKLERERDQYIANGQGFVADVLLGNAYPALAAEILSLRAHCEAMAAALQSMTYKFCPPSTGIVPLAAYRADYPAP